MILSTDLPLNASDKVGTVVRIKEHMRSGNCVCTGDSNALLIHRVVDGWLYKCFRCGDKGKIKSDGVSPKDVLAYVKMEREEYEHAVRIGLPEDSIPATFKSVPEEAVKWLMKYRISRVNMVRYNIGWSEGYGRIIFPIKNTSLLNPKEPWGKLLGWVGRGVTDKAVSIKWLKKKDLKIDNFFYHIPRSGKIVVLVEDVVSAIRVAEETGVSTIALMGTHIPNELLIKLKTYDIKVWLDKDAFCKAINFWKKCNCLGYKCEYIYTNLDPKEYDGEKIRHHLEIGG